MTVPALDAQGSRVDRSGTNPILSRIGGPLSAAANKEPPAAWPGVRGAPHALPASRGAGRGTGRRPDGPRALRSVTGRRRPAAFGGQAAAGPQAVVGGVLHLLDLAAGETHLLLARLALLLEHHRLGRTPAAAHLVAHLERLAVPLRREQRV